MRDFLGLETITKKLEHSIESELDKMGLMYRIFSRVKSPASMKSKIEKKDYLTKGEKITDIIGVRITLYFKDDVDLVYKILKSMKNFDHESTDIYSIEEFKPVRCNLTFNLIDDQLQEAISILGKSTEVIDTKYEIQIRTVLSEGWHEVEHDLRYKCKNDWNGHDDLNRNLNGIFATFETSEFSMLQIFENLCYRHYKDNLIEPLIKTKFRVRLTSEILNDEIKSLLISDKELFKKFYRVDRHRFLSKFLKSRIVLPLTIDNLIL